MKKLITIAVLGLSLSGFALADDASDISWVQPTMGQPFDGQTLGRTDYPEPTSTTSGEGVVIIGNDRASPAS
ncbi:MAG: hypothetical protein DRR03_01495 [Gammaproteobacteria bacterium]|nr:MAG: hypothetical protein DRR03_01495 [Gammaproteobacteria bacterium]